MTYILTNDVYQWAAKGDSFAYSGNSHVLENSAKKLGLAENEVQEELRRRKMVLEWMVENKIRRYTDVATIIREYYADPARIYRKARLGRL